MSDLAIATHALTRRFGERRAVDALTLEIPRGIVFGFLGPNGAGKTTTIRLLLGLLSPSSGSASVLGYDVSREADAIRAACGALLEYNGLYERLTAEDNLEFYGRAWRMSRRDRRERIHELLSRFGLWERRRDIVGGWSRGMKQKLALARAIVHRPALVFLDEPTASLDPEASAMLRHDIRTAATQDGLTVFLTTHNLAEADRICDRLGIMRDGRLLAHGTSEELRSRVHVQWVRVTGTGLTPDVAEQLKRQPGVLDVAVHASHLVVEVEADRNAGQLANGQLANVVSTAGGRVQSITVAEPTLEDAYLALARTSRAN